MSNTVFCQAFFDVSAGSPSPRAFPPRKHFLKVCPDSPKAPGRPDLLDFPAKISLPGIDGKAIGITGINAHRDWNAFAVDEQPHPYDRKRPVFLVLAVLAKGSKAQDPPSQRKN